MSEEQIVAMDFNQLSEAGLLYLINKQVLHPLGLSLTLDSKTGKSNGAIIALDLIWEFSSEIEKEYRVKLEKFLKHRETNLRKLLLEVEENI